MNCLNNHLNKMKKKEQKITTTTYNSKSIMKIYNGMEIEFST